MDQSTSAFCFRQNGTIEEFYECMMENTYSLEETVRDVSLVRVGKNVKQEKIDNTTVDVLFQNARAFSICYTLNAHTTMKPGRKVN